MSSLLMQATVKKQCKKPAGVEHTFGHVICTKHVLLYCSLLQNKIDQTLFKKIAKNVCPTPHKKEYFCRKIMSSQIEQESFLLTTRVHITLYIMRETNPTVFCLSGSLFVSLLFPRPHCVEPSLGMNTNKRGSLPSIGGMGDQRPQFYSQHEDWLEVIILFKHEDWSEAIVLVPTWGQVRGQSFSISKTIAFIPTCGLVRRHSFRQKKGIVHWSEAIFLVLSTWN